MRLSLFVRSVSELHTQYFFICFLILILLISSHYCTVLSDAISICFLPFFSLTRPFILCSHLYSHSGFVLFSFFLSFFFLTHSHRWVLSAHSCTCLVLFFLCLSHRFDFISLVFQFSFFYITLHAHIHAAHISACLVFSYSYWAIYSLYLLNS